MSFLELEGKTIVVTGVANKKSVAWFTGQALHAAGAEVVYVVRSEQRRQELERRLEQAPIYVCDVEREEEIEALRETLATQHPVLHGLVHSIAFADYASAPPAFHEVSREHFLQAVDVSCYSFIRLTRAVAELLQPGSSVVTISISDTQMAAENYGFMAPAKAALESAVVFLAKSFAKREIRFNSVKAGPLKTSASAGIPGYVESYLFAESCTLRGRGVATREVADTAVFLLSPRSGGINAQGIVVDAGMAHNYFDRDVVVRATRMDATEGESPGSNDS